MAMSKKPHSALSSTSDEIINTAGQANDQNVGATGAEKDAGGEQWEAEDWAAMPAAARDQLLQQKQWRIAHLQEALPKLAAALELAPEELEVGPFGSK